MCQIRAPATAAGGTSGSPEVARTCPGNGSEETENGFSGFRKWLGSEGERANFGEFQLCHGKWPQPGL